MTMLLTVPSATALPLDLAEGDLAGPAVRILADSISPDGVRLTTFEDIHHRIIHSEFMTHKVIGKCAASSRAIPLRKTIEAIRRYPAYPVQWTSEQKGMKGGDALTSEQILLAQRKWQQHAEASIQAALALGEQKVHKSLANRLLESFQWIKVVSTATAWENFFALRDHPDAQPEFRAVAAMMHEAYLNSTPAPRAEGEWHLPYVTDHDRNQVADLLAAGDPALIARVHPAMLAAFDQAAAEIRERLLAQISAARCARTSYLTNPIVDADGRVIEEARIDIWKDFGLVDDLIGAQPRHWSPFEHQATPWAPNRQGAPVPFTVGAHLVEVPTAHLPRVGNLLAWRHQRTETEALLGEVTFR